MARTEPDARAGKKDAGKNSPGRVGLQSYGVKIFLPRPSAKTLLVHCGFTESGAKKGFRYLKYQENRLYNPIPNIFNIAKKYKFDKKI